MCARRGPSAGDPDRPLEAIGAVEEALLLVDCVPTGDRDRRRLELVLQHALSLSLLGRFDEILQRLERERPRLEQLRDPALSSAYFFRLAFTLSCLGDLTRSAAEAQRALAEAEQCGDEATAGKALYVLALHSYYAGAHVVGVDHARRAATLLSSAQRETHWLGMAHWIRGMNHLVLGEFPEALAAEAEVVAIGQWDGDRRLQSFAASTTGWVHATWGDWQAGIAACLRGVELAPDPVSTAFAFGRLGQAYLEQGLPSEALHPLEEAAALLGRLKFSQVYGYFVTLLGEAHLGVGELEPARRLIARGFEITRETGYLYARGWAMRALGRLTRALGDFTGAEQHLAGGLQVFLQIGARFEAARTRLDLAGITWTRGDPDSAAGYLAEAREAFDAMGVSGQAVERAQRRGQPLSAPTGSCAE